MPTTERLGLVAEYAHPMLGQLRQFGTLVDFSESPTGPYGPPPLVGQHTRRIIERVGYSSQEIEDLLDPGYRLRAHRGLSLDALKSSLGVSGGARH